VQSHRASADYRSHQAFRTIMPAMVHVSDRALLGTRRVGVSAAVNGEAMNKREGRLGATP